MSKRLFAILSIAASCVIADLTANEAVAASVYDRATATSAVEVSYRDTERGYWNGYRGYRAKRFGYRKGPDGYWYPAKAFGRGGYSYQPKPLRGACNLGFRPTNGPHNCNY
ncbi:MULTISPECIES: hypothetical protein [Rhizobium]|uniref:hypothetical protein n=1 Tax=Rhizobium TaxID=379 RepID=UPI001441130C|nr:MULTISPECIES: hypothetical protein [Rhizobium]MBY3252668.1 hypothetical protein [Rhizobium laguerreae]NKN01580.1 hypothetical protein [Rhizobium leguminosarum bv. viciae]